MDEVDRWEAEGVDKVRALLALPMPARDRMGEVGRFDPWELFPCLYGSYDSEFDQCAIEVLCDVRDRGRCRTDLAARMFREMLCNAELCDYGTSPRGCFPTIAFEKVLQTLIDRWRAYAELRWGEPVTESN